MKPTESDSAPTADLLVLQQIARVISRGDDSESRIQDILRHIGQSAGLVRGRVLLADPAAGEIFIRYAHGLTPAELERGRYRIGEGISGEVFQTGTSAVVANVHDEPGYLARAVPRAALPPEQVAFLAVPIVRAHLPVGVLAAQRVRNHERPAQCDLALLEVIATMIGQILCADDHAEPRTARTGVGHRNDFDDSRRDLQLRTAEQWHAQGRLHLAADRYLSVVDQWSSTEQAQTARARLLDIARYYEGRGANRLALDVLERLHRTLDEEDGAGGRSVWDQGPGAANDDDSGFDRWDSFGGGVGAGRYELRPGDR